MKLTRPLQDFIAATLTPFHADGAVAPDVVAGQAEFLAAQGVRTVFITGTTGECHSLSCSERSELYDAWAEAGPRHGLAVIAHVGGNSIVDAKGLARRAARLGLAATSALAPSYYKPADLDSLIDWCAAIAAEAPELPFYYYDIPAMTGVTLPVDAFLRLAPARIPNLAGVKFTNPDLIAYRRSLDVAGDRFDLPWGIDEALLGGLATGGRSAIGSTYNFAPRLYADLAGAFARGELAEARRLQSLSVRMVDIIAAHGFLGTAKMLLTRLGVPVGPPRLPLRGPTPEEFSKVWTALDAIGFQEWGAAPRGA